MAILVFFSPKIPGGEPVMMQAGIC